MPDISFRTHSLDYTIKKVILRRETRRKIYPKAPFANGVPLVLSMVEHQDLYIQGRRFKSGLYRAVGGPRDGMVSDGRLWYTVTISSQEIDDALRENEHLEIGEESAWKTADVLQDNVKDGAQGTGSGAGKSARLDALKDTLVAVIKRIDDVGFHNKQIITYGDEKKEREEKGRDDQ